MRYIVAIDVGIKNLGLCVFDLATCKFVFWNNVSLVPNGRYLPANNVQYVRDFVHTAMAPHIQATATMVRC